MKNKLLVLFLLIIFSACEKREIIAQIPDQPGFCLGDVLAITGGSCLSDAFTNSDAGLFDPAYGSKTMNPQCLCGFRNYGTGTVPVAPVATAATNIECESFTANWGGVSNATGYWLYVAYDINLANLVEYWDVGNVTTSEVMSLTTNTTYYYGVKAYNTVGIGATSNIINLTTRLSYDDWQMPTGDDLISIYNNLKVNGIGGFSNANYWSNVVCGADAYYTPDFTDNRVYCRNVSNQYLVRPVRVFNAPESSYNIGDVGPSGGWIYGKTYEGGDITQRTYRECTSVTYERWLAHVYIGYIPPAGVYCAGLIVCP